MFDDEIILVANPLSKCKNSNRKKPQAVKSAPKTPAKKSIPKRKAVRDKPIQVQDCVGELGGKDTYIVHVSGDEYWTLIKEDADRLSDHMIFCYMYKRFGYKAKDLKIIRPAS